MEETDKEKPGEQTGHLLGGRNGGREEARGFF
jgi:hypothetical protein